MIARELIKVNEGCRLTAYRCTAGRLTIGYGRNLEDKGITQTEAELLLDLDLAECVKDLEQFPFWADLDKVRRAVLTDMRFQMGSAGLRAFKNMLSAIDRRDYDRAADELLDSRYARQTPARAQNNARMMRTGEL